MNNMSRKILYATNAPAHYKVEMLNVLANRFSSLTVLYLAKKDYIRQWRNPLERTTHKYIEAGAYLLPIRRVESSQMFSAAAIRHYFRLSPDVLIAGPYSQLTLIVLAVLTKLRQKKLIIWYESNAESALSKGWLRRLSSFLRKRILNLAHAVVVSGRKSYEHCVQQGIPSERLFIAPHSIPNEWYTPIIKERKKGRKAGPPRFLFIGRNSIQKDIPGLFAAFRLAQKLIPGVSLSCLGLRRETLQIEIPNGVVFLSFVEPDQVPKVIEAYDALLLTSTQEPWGLVVNEAIASGCPVIVTSCCGASEIVKDGFNGFVVEPENPQAVASAMLKLVAAQEEIDPQEISADLCNRYNFEKMADGFEQAVNYVLKN